jgi:ubiquinone/menaquinone biosynthesis C-methylase UbiE
VVHRYSKIGLWPSEQRVCEAFWPHSGRILDIGCGAGRTTIPLVQQGYAVTGTDISVPMVRQGHRLNSTDVQKATWAACDAADLPFSDGVFDGALFSYNGIELVPGLEEKERVLTEVCRVLKSGGKLIFTTHAFEAFNRFAFFRIRQLFRFWCSRILRRSIEEREMGEVVYDPDRNLEVYYMQIVSPRIYRRMLKESGFELEYYNSRQRIDSDRAPAWFVDFDPDFKFYVAGKIQRENAGVPSE